MESRMRENSHVRFGERSKETRLMQIRKVRLAPTPRKGEAIAHVANGHAETFGIELSDARAKEAEDRLARVLNCAYEYAVLTDETFSLVLLNPPYDGQEMTGGGKRMEETFLLDCGTTHKLRAGGVLIYIIPHSRINESIARHLAGWYDNLRCFKLPGEEYDAFKQFVIFGKRKESYTAPKGEILSNVLAWKGGQQISGFAVEEVLLEKDGQPVLLDDGQPKTTKVKKPVYAPLPELVAGHGEYEVPPSPLRGKGGAAFRWQYQAVSEDDYLREAEDAAARLDAGREWRDLFPRLEPPTIEPAMTPKRGHIAMQMSGGLLGTNLARDPSGQALLLKGNVTKRRVTEFEDAASDDDDDNGLTKVKIVEQFQTMLSTLSADGEFVTHTDPAAIRDLMEKYVEQLASIVQTRNVPQYDMKPEAWEWAVFDNLSKGRRLPGRNETGLTDFQKHLATALGRLCLTHGAGFINAEMGSGKAQPQHAKLLTPDGWRTMGNICVGDKVIGADGNPTKVLGVYPQGEKDIYRVAFTDGSWAECCDDHLWAVQTPLNKWKGKAARVLSLRDVRRLGLAHVNGNLQHFIPIVKPIGFAVRDLPIVPYLLGVLLGDGGLSSSRVMLSSSDEELLSDVAQLLPSDVLLRHLANYDWQITTGKVGGGLKYRANSMFSRLRELGLLGSTSANKFIPETYLLADVAQRTQLLQGLLDTDGYVSPRTCTIEYVTVSPRLADDVSFLVQSLGGTVTRRLKLAPRYWYKGERRTGKMAYRLFLALPNGIQPFRLSRKMDNYRPGTKYHPSRAIKSIEFVGRMPAQCIKVEAGDGLYLTDNCVVTHNTSVGIAIAEYLRVAVERKGKTGAYPALVVGPGIVTGKENWPKEIAEVTPGADSRVLTAGVKPLPKPMKIGDWLKEVIGLTLADDEFEGLNAKRALALVQHTAKKQKKSLSDDTLAALAQSLRYAEANPPDRRKGAKSPNPLDGRIGGFLWLGVSVPRDADHAAEVRGRYSLAQFIAEYQSGALPEKTFAVMSFETAKLQSGRVSAMGSRRAVVTRKDEDGEEYEETVQVCACPHCGSIVAENYDAVTGEPDMVTAITAIRAEQFIGTKRRFCKAPVRYFNTFTRRWEAGKRVWDAESGKHVHRALDEDDEPYVCGAPLFEVSSLRRVAAVEYLKRKARSAFGLCLVDEIHKAKAKGTGAGWALSVLGNVTRWTVGLTGTLFGGYSAP